MPNRLQIKKTTTQQTTDARKYRTRTTTTATAHNTPKSPRNTHQRRETPGHTVNEKKTNDTATPKWDRTQRRADNKRKTGGQQQKAIFLHQKHNKCNKKAMIKQEKQKANVRERRMCERLKRYAIVGTKNL